MARGDAFVDAYLSIPANTTVEIRPANGVEIMIFHILGGSHTYAYVVLGRDSNNNMSYNFFYGIEGGETSATSVDRPLYFFKRASKIIITNSEFIGIRTYDQAVNVSIFGIQIK
jgi:hypothetical protein